MALKKIAINNARVTKGTNNNQSVVKEGVPLDHSVKHLNTSSVGVSIGSTLNMGDYQSLRVDVWLTDSVQENESIEGAYMRVTKIVKETLEEIVELYEEE